MRVKSHNKIYDVQPLEILSKGSNNQNQSTQRLPKVVLDLIYDYYLKDSKAS